MQKQNFPFPSVPSPRLTPTLTKESGHYSMWVSSPCCPSRKEPKDVSSVGKPVAL